MGTKKRQENQIWIWVRPTKEKGLGSELVSGFELSQKLIQIPKHIYKFSIIKTKKTSETGKGDDGKKEIKQDKEEHITMGVGIFWRGHFSQKIYILVISLTTIQLTLALF